MAPIKGPPKQAARKLFPAKGMVNAYGFLHLSNRIAEAFGAPQGKKTLVAMDIVGTGGVAREGGFDHPQSVKVYLLNSETIDIRSYS